jgi:hypothetical protein
MAGRCRTLAFHPHEDGCIGKGQGYGHWAGHWGQPSNPVDLQQREGREYCHKAHLIRRDLALSGGLAAKPEL